MWGPLVSEREKGEFKWGWGPVVREREGGIFIWWDPVVIEMKERNGERVRMVWPSV